MFHTVVKRDGNNPITGKAQYRVIECFKTAIDWLTCAYFKDNKQLHLTTVGYKKVGTITNPRKELFTKEKQ